MLTTGQYHLDAFRGRIPKGLPDMTAAMRMEVEGVSAIIVKLINESDSQCTDNTEGQRRKKKFTVNLIGNPWSDDKCHDVDQDDDYRRYN